MNTPPVVVIAYALTVLWAFTLGAVLIEQSGHLAVMSVAEIGAAVAGLVTPMALLWMCVLLRLQRVTLEARFGELLRRHEDLALKVRLSTAAADAAASPADVPEADLLAVPKTTPSRAPRGGDYRQRPEPLERTERVSLLGGVEHRIQVIEGDEVGPEFIHRATGIVDGWIEVEFRNVGGPATNLIAITEGDTDTHVDAQNVGSWKSVRVSLQPLVSLNEAFRFCLVFEGPDGAEKQQFFRYGVDDVVSISRPDT